MFYIIKYNIVIFAWKNEGKTISCFEAKHDNNVIFPYVWLMISSSVPFVWGLWQKS